MLKMALLGKLVVDRGKLKYPGDLLHEAEHLAVVETSRRQSIGAYVGFNTDEGLGAIAWSWAALKEIHSSLHDPRKKLAVGSCVWFSWFVKISKFRK